ncbi:MAG: TolC family protein [Planctomycetaceae bacterium]|nr:TolC family protein [Planctomycetaceae bacterium]
MRFCALVLAFGVLVLFCFSLAAEEVSLSQYLEQVARNRNQAVEAQPQNVSEITPTSYQAVTSPGFQVASPQPYYAQQPYQQPGFQQPYQQPSLPQPLIPSRDLSATVQPAQAFVQADIQADFVSAWTLDQAISATLTSDPRLRIGQEDIRQARAEYWTSSLRPNPTFAAEAGTLPYKRWNSIDPGGELPGGPPELGLTIEYPIDWFLFAKRKAAMNSAGWEIRQTQAEYADLIRERVTETAVAFYDVLEAKALLALAQQDVEILANLESIIQRAVDAKGMPPIELKRIGMELLHSRQELLEAETTLDILKAKLRSQFGRSDYDPTFDVTGNLDAPTEMDPMPLEAAFATARQNRPDIRALQMQVAKAQADVHLENRNAYPEVATSVGFSHQYQQPYMDDYSGWGVGLSVSVPLFDRNQGNRAKARSALTQNTLKLQTGIVDLRAEIVEADRNFRMAHRQTHAIADEELRLSTEIRDTIIEAYKIGGYTLIDVLDAERSYRETYRLFITSRADYWRSLYIYNSVVGINSVNDVRPAGN